MVAKLTKRGLIVRERGIALVSVPVPPEDAARLLDAVNARLAHVGIFGNDANAWQARRKLAAAAVREAWKQSA